ncbi:MAG: EF-hand domain-containing protein [Planctomycetota bacterium]
MYHSRNVRTLAAILVAAAALTGAARADDALTGAIDPYDAVAERQKFLTASGIDNQLSQQEFAAASQGQDPLARPYESWEKLAGFDADANGLIGWLELEAARMDLRKKLLADYDADGNGKLTGTERDKALASLNVKPASAAAGQAEKPDKTGLNSGDWIKPYDTDGDGILSQAEANAAAARLRRQWQAQSLQQFDTDGDGQLSEEERSARRKYWRSRQRAQQREWMLRYFDDDGDGEISQAERKNLRQMDEPWKKFGKELEQLVLDTNGDGEITGLEKAAVGAAWMGAGTKFMLKAHHWSDADGDGVVSFAEREQFETRTREALLGWFDKFAAGYDADASGNYSQAERIAAMEGLQTEIRNRLARADVDQDGNISPDEGFAWLESFGREIKAIPDRKADRTQAETENPDQDGQIE